ncbi:MAG TPA: hypothetical protein VFM86_10015 [Pedococcus sp.]|nr:hypothetical protein [Pedococcus sp.]
MLTTAVLLRQLGLGPAWAEPLEAELVHDGVARDDGAWDVEATQGWVHRLEAAGDLLTVRDLRIVVMWLEGFPPVVIRDRANTKLRPERVRRTALTLAVRYRQQAVLLRGGAAHRLVLGGFPPAGTVPNVVLRAVERLWLGGAPRADIARATALGRMQLARAVAGLPPRLSVGEVTARFGWSPANVNQKLAHGSFPLEDGRDGPTQHKRWWWPTTIEAWEQSRTLTQCPHCPARVERLGPHLVTHQQ